MTEIPGWVINVPPSEGVHGTPASQNQWDALSENEVQQRRGQLLESIISVVVQAITGFFSPGKLGSAQNQLTDWAQDLSDTLGDVPIIGDLVEIFTGIEDGNLNDLGTWINNLFGGPGATSIPEGSVPSVPSLRDVIKNAIDLFLGTGWTDVDLFAAFRGQSETIAQTAAAVAAIQARLDSAQYSGLVGKDRFEYTDADSLDPALWQWEWLTGNVSDGYVTTSDGHNAGGVHLGNGSWQQLNRFIGTNHTTQTDYQRINVVIAQTMQGAPFFADERRSYHDLYMRMNATQTQWVRLRIFSPVFLSGNVTLQFQYKNGGSIQNLGAAFIVPNFAVGASITVDAGTAGGARNFRVVTSTGTVIASATDDASVTAMGASNREAGYGAGFTNDDVISGALAMGKIVQWTLTDNTDVATVGSFARVHRASTSQATLGGVGDRQLAANTFDTTVRATTDITFTASNNSFVVANAGPYLFQFGLHQTAAMITSSPEPLLYVIPAGGSAGVRLRGPEQYFGTASHTRLGGTFLVYLGPGDAVAPGVASPTFTPGFSGNTNGDRTWMQIAGLHTQLGASS